MRPTVMAVILGALPVAAGADTPGAAVVEPVVTSPPVADRPSAVFTLRGGVAAAPDYFGANSYEVGPDLGFSLGYLRLGGLEFGNPDPDFRPDGFGLIGSFRFVPERDAGDFGELDGLEDIDATLEVGLGGRYRTDNWEAFAAGRYGLGGHESWVAVAGADALFPASDRLTLRAGPRVLFGTDDYADTYFGVSADEAAAGPLEAYDAQGGLVSAGVEIGGTYVLNDTWGVDGAVRWERLMGDAADSPIVENEDQLRARIGVTRRFTLEF